MSFRLFLPKGRISTYVQGVWSASVAKNESNSVNRWLQGDACSGILFNLGRSMYLDDVHYSDNVIFLPVSKHAHTLVLPPGAQLAGVRFHPGISVDVFGKHYETPVAVESCERLPDMRSMALDLVSLPGHVPRIVTLYRWLNTRVDFSGVVPATVRQVLNTIQKDEVSMLYDEAIPLSQRQLERQFQRRMDMTMKQYQRLVRVQKTLNLLRNYPDCRLVDVAAVQGFSDQAHMTREVKQIARITPRKYSRLAKVRQR